MIVTAPASSASVATRLPAKSKISTRTRPGAANENGTVTFGLKGFGCGSSRWVVKDGGTVTVRVRSNCQGSPGSRPSSV